MGSVLCLAVYLFEPALELGSALELHLTEDQCLGGQTETEDPTVLGNDR